MDLCHADGCDSRVSARSLCVAHYNRARRAGTLPPRPQREGIHYLTDIDEGAARATCAVCGPTRIRVRRGNRGHQCWTLRQQEPPGQRRPTTPKERRDWRIKKEYGLTPADYDALVARQDGRCAICQQADVVLCVDHDHATGAVRGLLCAGCNSGIGRLRDNLALVEAAADYLRRYAT